MSHTSHLQERSPTSIGLLFLQSCLNICLWSLKSESLANKFLTRSSRTWRSPIDLQSNLCPSRKLPGKSHIFLRTMRWELVPFDRLPWKTCLAFDLKNKSRRSKQCSLWQLRVCQAQNHENSRKQRERTLSVRTLGPCGAATAKKKNLLRPSSFLLRRSPSNVQCVMPLHRLLISLYAPSRLSWLENGCIHVPAPRIAEANHSQQIDRIRGDDVLAKEHCLYERDRRLLCEVEKTSLRLSAMCGWLPFFSEVDKDVDPR